MAARPASASAVEYFRTPQRRQGESLTEYAERLAIYDANYSPPKLIEPPKPKPRYRAKAWSSAPQTQNKGD